MRSQFVLRLKLLGSLALIVSLVAAARGDELADVIKSVREQAPIAASLSAADFAKLAKAEAVPKASDVENQSLTLLVFAAQTPEKPTAEQLAEFQSTKGGPLQPAKLAGAISQRFNPLVSVLQPSYIKEVTAKVAGESATGDIQFEAKNVYRGHVEYTATKRAGKWTITEFRFPALGLKTSLTDGGHWKIAVPEKAGPYGIGGRRNDSWIISRAD